MTAYAAYLRVYQPLAAFEGEERQRWADAVVGSVAPPVGAALEREAAVRALLRRSGPAPAGTGPATIATVLPAVAEQAYVAEVDGVTLVCPWRTTLRALEGLEEFVAELPDELLRAFALPGAEVASDGLARWREQHPGVRTSQLTSTWQVPLRWFVLVGPEEREVEPGQPGQPGRSLIYRTAMSRARRRVARALDVLRRTVEDGVITAGVEELGRWLEEFHPRSLVELDYGGLVHLLDDAELRQDESARDVAAALTALAEGHPERAAAAYGLVTARMKGLQAIESAN